jgi:RNA polymerase sigma-70 factor (ECF subfamily)
MTTRAPALLRVGADASATEAPRFERVYDDQFDFVWRSLRGLGVADASLDDAVQDVFVVVHRRLGEFEGRASLQTWLYAIARRVGQRYRRSASRRHERDAALDDHLVDAQAVDPAAEAQRAEATRLLLELVAELDDDKREVFVLVEIEQRSVPEVAEMLGLKLNTAYSRLRLARQRFEAAIARRDPSSKETP